MKMWLCTGYENEDQIKWIHDAELSSLGETQVYVKIIASAINFPDTLIIQNIYQWKPELPFSPCGEWVGIVEDIGKEVNTLKKGDRVMGLTMIGGLAEFGIWNHNDLTKLDENIGFELACSSFYNLHTVYYSLIQRGNLTANDTVVIRGAAGGLGLAAIQICSLLGAKTVACVSSTEKEQKALEFGATLVVNTTRDELNKKVEEFTHGKGASLVFDTIGGQNASDYLKTLQTRGKYMTVGFASGEIPSFKNNWILLNELEIIGVSFTSFRKNNPQKYLENTQFIIDTLKAKIIKPYISTELQPEAAKDYLLNYSQKSTWGKTIVIWDQKSWEFDKTIERKAIHKAKIFTHKLEFIRSVGVNLGKSNIHFIDQRTILAFAGLTQDYQWIHTHSENMKDSPFSTNVAHGYLTLSMVSKMLSEIYTLAFAKSTINYGVNNLKFKKPVLQDTYIWMEAWLKEVKTLGENSLKVTIKGRIFSDLQKTPVCEGEFVYVVMS
ncbi:MAG: zinc-binding dehydrogenase [Leadbetterella sp.]